MSEYDFSDCAAIDAYHDAPRLCSASPSDLGTFEVSHNVWSSHSQLRALCAVVMEAAAGLREPNVEYSMDEIALYVIMTENVARSADRLLDASLSGSKYNQYRFQIIEQLAVSLQFAPVFYERLVRLVAFAKSNERDMVCNVLRTGIVRPEDHYQLFVFHMFRTCKLFPEKTVLSCLKKANENYRSMLFTTFRIDIANPDAIKFVEASVGASAGASVPETDLAPMLPELSFSNESSTDPVWKKPKKPKKLTTANDVEAQKPKKRTNTVEKASTWKKKKTTSKEDPLPSGLLCATGCGNVAQLAGRCAGLCCPKALCNACDQKSDFRYICDTCKPKTTGGYLSVDTHPVRQIVYHMFSVDDPESLSVTEYFRTSKGISCAIKKAAGADMQHAYPRTSHYVSFSIDEKDGQFQASRTVQYETFVQARNDGANGKMHTQIDQLISGTIDVVYPKLEHTSIDQIIYTVNAGKCVIELQ